MKSLLAIDCKEMKGLPVVLCKLPETHERRLRSQELVRRG